MLWVFFFKYCAALNRFFVSFKVSCIFSSGNFQRQRESHTILEFELNLSHSC